MTSSTVRAGGRQEGFAQAKHSSRRQLCAAQRQIPLGLLEISNGTNHALDDRQDGVGRSWNGDLFRDGVLLHQQAGMLPASALDALVEKVRRIDMDDVRRRLDAEELAAPRPPELKLAKSSRPSNPFCA